jgi:hypothetical protein
MFKEFVLAVLTIYIALSNMIIKVNADDFNTMYIVSINTMLNNLIIGILIIHTVLISFIIIDYREKNKQNKAT